MKIKNKLKAAISILIVIAISVCQYLGVFNKFELTLEDSLYQTGSAINENIFVIGIDEETLDRYGAFDTWSRDKIADIINKLMEGENKPKVIAVDIGLFGEKGDVDDKLVEAVKNAGNVVITSSVTSSNTVNGYKIILMEEPFDELKKVCKAFGFSNLIFDDDGVVRHSANQVIYNGDTYYSFDREIAKAYISNEDAFKTIEERFYISYSSKSHAYYGPTGSACSFYKVLEGLYPTDDFKDGIVIIGAYASGTQDNYYTSIDKDNQMYGAEIHANIVNQILNEDFKHEINSWQTMALTLLFAIIATYIVEVADEKKAILNTVVLAVIYIGICKLLYIYVDYVTPIIYVILAIILITINHIVVTFIKSEYEKQKIVDNYSRYMAPELAKVVASNEDSLKLGGIKKDIAVLFVDIRGFTTLSENISPEELVLILNEYFEITTKSIIDNNGIIDKFIGDATMGLFNAITDLNDYVYHAVCAGLEMIELSKILDDKLPEEFRGKVHFGVGVHKGPAIVGNIGTHFRMDYTAIGDTVNTSSRIEGQAKASQLLVSEDVYLEVKDRFEFEDAGFISLKGKKADVHVYSVISKK